MDSMKMKTVVFLLGVLTFSSAFADDYDNDLSDIMDAPSESVNSHDACTIVFCMAGSLFGEKSQECQPAIREFYSIRAIGHHGFDPGKTLSKRKGILGSCPTADRSIVNNILKKFGRSRG